MKSGIDDQHWLTQWRELNNHTEFPAIKGNSSLLAHFPLPNQDRCRVYESGDIRVQFVEYREATSNPSVSVKPPDSSD
jgi:hypothetical protein